MKQYSRNYGDVKVEITVRELIIVYFQYKDRFHEVTLSDACNLMDMIRTHVRIIKYESDFDKEQIGMVAIFNGFKEDE